MKIEMTIVFRKKVSRENVHSWQTLLYQKQQSYHEENAFCWYILNRYLFMQKEWGTTADVYQQKNEPTNPPTLRLNKCKWHSGNYCLSFALLRHS